MKSKLFLIIIFLLNLPLFPQVANNSVGGNQTMLGWGVGEIYVGTHDLDSNDYVNYRMSAMGTVWEGGPLVIPDYSIDTDNSHTLAYGPKSPFATTDTTDFETENDWIRFRMIQNDLDNDTYGYGLYKFYVNQYDAYFYIDYRDNNYGDSEEYQNCPGGQCWDIWLKYEADLDIFYVMNDALWGAKDPDDTDWEQIPNGTIIYFWELKNQSSPATDDLPNFWSNSLCILTDENKPTLVWGKRMGAEEYKIYRRVTDYGDPPGNPAFFTHIATEEDTSIFSYVDTEYTQGGTDSTAHYYVKAVLSSSSENSNIVNTPVLVFKDSKTETDFLNYFLFQNTPNPFNPSTKIKYFLTKKGYTVLNIYNTLGQEVAKLVDEFKSAGKYSVEFDASNLPSGVYFYKLQSGTFIDVKKMILIK